MTETQSQYTQNLIRCRGLLQVILRTSRPLLVYLCNQRFVLCVYVFIGALELGSAEFYMDAIRQATQPPSILAELSIHCFGHECYRMTHIITVSLSAFATLLAFVLFIRNRMQIELSLIEKIRPSASFTYWWLTPSNFSHLRDLWYTPVWSTMFGLLCISSCINYYLGPIHLDLANALDDIRLTSQLIEYGCIVPCMALHIGHVNLLSVPSGLMVALVRWSIISGRNIRCTSENTNLTNVGLSCNSHVFAVGDCWREGLKARYPVSMNSGAVAMSILFRAAAPGLCDVALHSGALCCCVFGLSINVIMLHCGSGQKYLGSWISRFCIWDARMALCNYHDGSAVFKQRFVNIWHF